MSIQRYTMMRSMLSVLLLLFPLISAELAPFFDPKKGVPQQLDVGDREYHTRRLKELKSIAIQRRIQTLLDSTDGDDSLDEPLFDSSDVGFNTDQGFDLGANVAPGVGFGKAGKGNGKGGQGKSGRGKSGQGKAGQGKSGQGKSGKGNKNSKKGKGNGGSGGNSGQSPEQLEFVMVRNEVGTPSAEAEFGVASVLGLNGYAYERTYSSDNPVGDQPIGIFFGICTVTNTEYGEMLCTYEIYLYTDGDYEIGGLIVNGPVESPQSTNLVTGAEYDFERYSGGVMTTLEDPELPILYVYVELV